MCRRKVRSLTRWTSTPSTASTASSSSLACSASLAEQVTSTTSRSWLESATSIAVTMPPACAIAVATAPTTPWSGAVCRRIVMEYDEVVAAMAGTFLPAPGYRQVSPRVTRVTREPSGGLLGAEVVEQVLREPLAHLRDDAVHHRLHREP